MVVAGFARVGGLEREQVGHGGRLEYFLEFGAEVVRVFMQSSAGLVGQVEEGVPAHDAGAVLLARVRPQAGDVDGVDRRVGAVELPQHLVDLGLELGVAEALIGVDLGDVPALDQVGLAPQLLVEEIRLAAEQEPAVETLREQDEVLAPLDRGQNACHLVQGVCPARDLAASEVPLGLRHLPADHLEVAAHAALHLGDPRVYATHVEGRRQFGRRPRRVDQEAQRVLGRQLEKSRIAQGRDRPRELGAVGREGDQELRTGFDGVDADRGEIRRVHLLQDEGMRRLLGLGDGGRGGVGEVEQEQEVAPGRRRNAVVRLDDAAVVRGDLVQIDHAETGERLRLALVQDLEVLGGQTADGGAVSRDDVDRHLDLEDELAVLELAEVPGSGLLGGRMGCRKQEAGQRRRGDEAAGQERPPRTFRLAGV